MDKELEAKKYISNVLFNAKHPAVLCSFGKDSMVMLHLVREVRPDLPVVFFKQPFFPKKNSFPNRIIEDWNLKVYDFPPIAIDYIAKGNEFDVVNWYNGFGNALIYLPNGTHKNKPGEEYVCAIADLINKPRVKAYEFKWDTIFIGHKNNDVDTILGQTVLKDKTVKLQEMTLALPIADWTDAEIWAYTEKHLVPYNEGRYNKADGYKEFTDKTYNGDYLACCYKCLDNKEPAEVDCPKCNAKIKNISTSDEQNAEKIKKVFALANYMENAHV